MPRTSTRKLHLPVRLVEGVWELGSGGEVPVKDGAEAVLVVNESAITDKAVLAQYAARTDLKILAKGTTLLACLNVKSTTRLPNELAARLIHWKELQASIGDWPENWSSAAFSAVEVTIGDASDKQARMEHLRDGGLWLTVEGNRAVGLTTSQIVLPDGLARKTAISLNHAFTLLSEAYEPWRLAHTGSVYERFLYKEADGKWWPLELLRDARIAKQKQKIAHALWQAFLARMSGKG